MMKFNGSKILFVILALWVNIQNGYSQNVAINGTGAIAAASAMLDISSTTSGLLIPRMTTAERNIIGAPATGLLVYDNTLNAFWYLVDLKFELRISVHLCSEINIKNKKFSKKKLNFKN